MRALQQGIRALSSTCFFSKQELFNAYIVYSIIIMPWYDIILNDNYLAKGVINALQGIDLLPTFFLV